MNVIYEINCKLENKSYIGMSQEYKKRWRAHINMLNRGIHNNETLQKDWDLYGESNFLFRVIEEFEDKNECMQREMSLVNSMDNLYNIVRDSSVGGDIFSNNPRKEVIREKRVKQMSGKGNHQYGKQKTEKMITSVKEANSKPVLIDDVEYVSLTDASKRLGIGVSTVEYRLKSNSKKFEKWQYKNK